MNIQESETAVVLEPAAPANAAVVWLHGLGADGHDFVPVVPELELPPELAVRFVFPHAPVRSVTVNSGMSLRAWYDILSAQDLKRQDETGIRDSERRVRELLQDQRAAGLAADRLVLAGFSQGGAIALHTGLRYPQRLAGILALSTYLPLAEPFVTEARPERRDTPVLMCHGQFDPLIPLSLGRHSRQILQDRGYAVDWREYPMQHQVCTEEISDIGRWLTGRFLPTPPVRR
ncbi:MAG: alpha/beta hydrolase [Nevskiales bacterium]|nr:alpha/beta hydrolase [Nevskiales bacterium]